MSPLNRPEGHDRLGPPPRTPPGPARDSGHGLVDTRLSSPRHCRNTVAHNTHRGESSSRPSALLLLSEHAERLFRASLRAAAIERAYACVCVFVYNKLVLIVVACVCAYACSAAQVRALAPPPSPWRPFVAHAGGG